MEYCESIRLSKKNQLVKSPHEPDGERKADNALAGSMPPIQV